MGSRKRFLDTINGKRPDRFYASLTSPVAKMLSTYYNFSYKALIDSLLSTRILHMNLLMKMAVDTIGAAATVSDDSSTVNNSGRIDYERMGDGITNTGRYNEF